MERMAGRMGGFWAPKRERDKLPLRKGKNKQKTPSSFPVGTESVRKQKAGETNWDAWPLVVFKTGAGGEGAVSRTQIPWAQNTGEKAQWREVRSKGGRESLIFFSFGEADIRQEGCREQAEEEAAPLVAEPE